MTRTTAEDPHQQALDGLQDRLMAELGTFLKRYPDVQPARVGAIVGQVYLAQYVVSYGDDACKAARETLDLIILDFERAPGKSQIQ
jgi:hypothetical protein